MHQLFKTFILTTFLLFLTLFVPQDIQAQDCANVPLSGNYTVTTSCAFVGSVNGVEQGNLTIENGVTLTINQGQTIVWNPGSSVVIEGSIAINTGSPGGQLRKSFLWLTDQDDDNYPATTSQVAASSQPVNGKRRSDTDFTGSFTYVSDLTADPDDNSSCNTGEGNHLCGEDVGGLCVPKAAGEQGLDACQRCDGTSTDPVNIYTSIDGDSGDSEGDNQCDGDNGDCYRCYQGECTYQAADQDLWGECTQGTGSSDGCRSNNCSGSGNTCGVQTSGDGGCPVCGRCTDSDEACEYHLSGTYDSGCSTCKGCTGSQIGACTGNPTTTWNAGTHGCGTSDQRCYGGSCRTCDGDLYDDGCSGCAGQGGQACWRWSGEMSCDSACSSYGGCVDENWNDSTNCDVCDSANCYASEDPAAPYWVFWPKSPSACYYRNNYDQDCGDNPGAWIGRFCVCEY